MMRVPSVWQGPPNFRPIHGLRGIGALGDDSGDDTTFFDSGDITDPGLLSILGGDAAPGGVLNLPDSIGGTLASGAALAPSSPTLNTAGQPTNWAGIIQSLAAGS